MDNDNPTDPPLATVEPAPEPTLEEYRKLLHSISSFKNDIARERRRREQMETNLRQDFHMPIQSDDDPTATEEEGSLSSNQNKKKMGPRKSMDDYKCFSDLTLDGLDPSPLTEKKKIRPVLENATAPSTTRADTRTFAGISLNPTSLHPKKNTVKFTAEAEKKHNYLDTGRIDEEGGLGRLLEGPAGDNPPENSGPEEIEGIDIPLLPHDTFSYLAFSKLTSISLLVSLFVIGVQCLTLTVLALDMIGEGENGNVLAIPSGINQSTATIQIVAIFIITVGQTDLHDSLNTLFVGYQAEELSQNIGRPIQKWRWSVSLWVRVSITLYALCVTFIMICTESDTTQVLLDFTSIEFVTNLDNIFFWLTAYGYLGFGAQKDATQILNAKPSAVVLAIPENDDGSKAGRRFSVRSGSVGLDSTTLPTKKRRRFPRLLFTTSLFVILMIGWGIIFRWIRDGEFLCGTVFVQFSDDSNPDLAPFTGLYDIGCSDQVSGCRRAKYGESKRGTYGNFSDSAKFAYCVQKASWGFTFGNETGDVLSGETSPCDWLAHSKTVTPKTQDSYDIMTTASEPWRVLNRRGIDVPFSRFDLLCFDCRHDASFCGAPDRGECVNNRCACKNGWYGRRCEFKEPCEMIEFTDPERDIIDGRKFATQYNRMYNDQGQPVEIYGRPVYEGTIADVSTNQVFFNGLRWVLTSNIGDLLRSEEFHGYWSAKWNQYTVEFYSAAVNVDSPEDATSPEGLEWFRPLLIERGRAVQGVDLKSSVPLGFLCASCNDDTNPCLYDGVCRPENSTCECTHGSSGRLCQIPPTENGRCDTFFNSREFSYDGGDCCKQTCVSTNEYDCGRDTVTNAQGVESIVFVGFDNCIDPTNARSVSGSRTIYDIQERGVLNCAMLFTTTWFYNFMVDQCRAMAAVVLDNPNAIQIFNFTNDRFTGLRDKQFDIVLSTDYTANRDVYETSARSGFNYATMPYYFGGFVFAGLKPFGKCADNGDFFSVECLDIKICLVRGTTWFDTASKVFPSETIVAYNNFESTVIGLQNNECNVIGGTQVDVALVSIRNYGYTGDESNYEVGSKLYFKGFETWLTRPDDRVWSRFTSWIFESLVQAEESKITQATSDQMGTTGVFGSEFSGMFQKAVAAVGNYGEMWERNLPFTRSGMNLINDGTAPAMLSYDFGRVSDVGPEPSGNSAIRKIIARDLLICGVTGEGLGFKEYDEDTGTWSGFEIDFCRGIAAALFGGDDTKIEVVLVTTAERFSKIKSGEVDLVPGATRTLEREVNFGVNNDAFDFSPVYFHDGMIFAGEMPHAMCAENQDFSNVDCSKTKICVQSASTWYNALVNTLDIDEEYLILTDDFAESMRLHVAGSCNVIVAESAMVNIFSLRAAGYLVPDDYYFGTKRFTKEPICLMHRSDDQQFSDLIRWIMFGFFYAEENGITSVNFFDMPETNLFGPDFTNMWQNSIRKVGNYAQIYERNIGEAVPRTGMNLLNDLSSPQLFAAPGTI
eukprot:CAMPEP_0113602058 /NCGR_PEP_ID=MMETSP0017_2-20120614/554_1 /TAXON_ID=2856 /ORGANISM="Cylindrotheca closterium" /LENGTH=1493 /DNA_ID=CAMNT_0000510381 /DNA_START=144 /DNA_END=4625 /DNA_ORIENTATION=- /assembly_acc=CAM_ASM_000147